MVGTLVAPAYSRRLGMGRAYVSGQLLASLAGAVLASGWLPLVLLAQMVAGLGMSLYGVPQRTLRQALVPEHLLAQVTATWRTLVIGGQAVGALAGVAVAARSPLRSRATAELGCL